MIVYAEPCGIWELVFLDREPILLAKLDGYYRVDRFVTRADGNHRLAPIHDTLHRIQTHSISAMLIEVAEVIEDFIGDPVYVQPELV